MNDPERPVQGGEPESASLFRRVRGRLSRGTRTVGRLYVGSVVGDVTGSRERIRETRAWLQELLRTRKSAENAESFDEAVSRLHVSAEELIQRRHSLRRMALIYFITAALALLALMLSPFSGAPLSQFFVSLGVLVLTLMRGMACRFRAAQIDARELFGFRAWITGEKGSL